MTNSDVEDVLSSIRRLVSEDARAGDARRKAKEAAADRLVLTPAQRVRTSDDIEAWEAQESLEQPEHFEWPERGHTAETFAAAEAEEAALEEPHADVDATDETDVEAALALDVGTAGEAVEEPVESGVTDETEGQLDDTSSDLPENFEWQSTRGTTEADAKPDDTSDDVSLEGAAYGATGEAEDDLSRMLAANDDTHAYDVTADDTEAAEQPGDEGPISDAAEDEYAEASDDVDTSEEDAVEAVNAPLTLPEAMRADGPTDATDDTESSIAEDDVRFEFAERVTSGSDTGVARDDDLGQKVAALETLIAKRKDEWEPDQSGQDAYAGKDAPAAMAWQDDEARDAAEDVPEDHVPEAAMAEDVMQTDEGEEATVVRLTTRVDDGLVHGLSREDATQWHNETEHAFVDSLADPAADAEPSDAHGSETAEAWQDAQADDDPQGDVLPDAEEAAWDDVDMSAEDRAPQADVAPDAATVLIGAAIRSDGDAAQVDTSGLHAEEDILDEAALRELVADIVREELQGALGERITRNVRKLVRREIHRALAAQDLD